MIRRRRPVRRQEENVRLRLPEGELEYRLKRSSARRTLALRVGEGGEVVVNAPLELAQVHIHAFLQRHMDWLRQRLAERAAAPAFAWRDGLLLPYRGAHLRLDWCPGHPATPLQIADTLRLGGPEATLAVRVVAWYRRQAQPVLAECLAHHAPRLGLAPPPWRLSDARTRWGSLSPKGVVSLNWRLIKASPEELDYVVCHELAHFRQRNHSPAFWREVAALCPDYTRVRARLKQRGRGYFEF